MSSSHEIRAELQKDIHQRGEAASRRSEDAKTRAAYADEFVSTASGQIMSSLADAEIDNRMSRLRLMHQNIVGNISQVQETTARILAEQEKDLMRAFKTKLVTIQSDLEDEKHKGETGAEKYKERNRVLENQVQVLSDDLEKIEKLNAGLTQEIARLRNQFRNHEKDHEFIVKQLVQAKAETGKAQAEAAERKAMAYAMQQEIDEIRTSQENDRMDRLARAEEANAAASSSSASAAIVSRMTEEEALKVADGVVIGTEPFAIHTNNVLLQAGGGGGGGRAINTTAVAMVPAGLPTVSEGRYRDVIAILKRLLDAERRSTKAARVALANEITAKTEAETLVRQVIAETRAEVAKKRAALQASSHSSSTQAAKTPVKSSLSPRLGTKVLATASAADTTTTTTTTTTTNISSPSSSSYDVLTTLSWTEKQSLLAQLLAQDAILNALPVAVFPPRRSPGDETNASGTTQGENKK